MRIITDFSTCPQCGRPELNVGVVLAGASNCRFEVTGLDGDERATVRVHPDGILQVEEVELNCDACGYEDSRLPTFDCQ